MDMENCDTNSGGGGGSGIGESVNHVQSITAAVAASAAVAATQPFLKAEYFSFGVCMHYIAIISDNTRGR